MSPLAQARRCRALIRPLVEGAHRPFTLLIGPVDWFFTINTACYDAMALILHRLAHHLIQPGFFAVCGAPPLCPYCGGTPIGYVGPRLSGGSPLFYRGVPEDGRDVFRARLTARFEHLDRHLSANEYLMGSDYSVADAHFFVVSNWANWVNFDLSPYHAINAYRKHVGARAAVVAALKAEGLVPWPATQPH